MLENDNLSYYAHVEDGTVVSVSIWDGVSEYDPGDDVQMVKVDSFRHYNPDGTYMDAPSVGIGWSYRDGQFYDERPEPEDLFE